MPYYASVQDVKDYTKLSYSDLGYSADDNFIELVQKCIDLAESYIDETCRVPRGFFKAGGMSFTEYADWDTPYIIASYNPIITLTSLSYDTTGYGQAPSWTALTLDTDFIYYADGRFYIFTKVPGKAEKSVKIVYTAGYSEVPGGIRLASTELASLMLHTIMARKVSPNIDMANVAIPQPYSIKLTEPLLDLIAVHKRH